MVLALALIAGAVFVSAYRPWQRTGSTAGAQGAPVQRGPLRITVKASGNLKAADTVRLTSGVEGRTTILSLAPEGSVVAEGDVVCELDATLLVERRIQQTITAGNAEAALVKASQARAIQESQNLSDLEKAARTIEFASQDLSMFLEGERQVELEKSQQAIDLAKEEAQRAQSRLTWSEELATKGFLTALELEADRLAEHRSSVMLQQATRERELLERYKLPRRESELRALLAEARLERERVELQAKARLVDFDSDVRSSTAELELEREKLVRLEQQIERAKLRAPCDGYVVYAQRDNDDPPIGEGVEVREREEILSIPSSSGMTAELKLHESVLKQVSVGQPCSLGIDALPGVVLEGSVRFVAMLPDQNSRWSNPNLRVYRCEIEITGADPGLRPGMSCSVEIRIEELADTLFVPVQAVFRGGEHNLAFVASADGIQRREVQVGRYTELWVQVLSGLAEGETVLLEAPPGFTPAPDKREPAEEREEPQEDRPEERREGGEERDGARERPRDGKRGGGNTSDKRAGGADQ